MLYLLIAVCCSVGVANVLKYSERKSLPMYGLFAVNYAAAAVIAFIGGGFQLPPNLSGELAGIGVVQGFLFIGCFVLMYSAIRKSGISISISVMRLAVVLPTLGSILLFGEKPGLLPVLGIIIAIGSLPLSTPKANGAGNLRQMLRNGLGVLLLLFLGYGAVGFLFKLQKELFPVANSYQFLTLIFPTAFLIAVTIVINKKIVITWQVLLAGLLLGIFNFFSTYFFVLALKELSGFIVYPFNGVGIILLTTITGIVFWKEKPAARNYVFIALALIAVVLIYQ